MFYIKMESLFGTKYYSGYGYDFVDKHRALQYTTLEEMKGIYNDLKNFWNDGREFCTIQIIKEV